MPLLRSSTGPIARAAFAVLLLAPGCGGSPEPQDVAAAVASYNYVAGTQTALSVYKFSPESLLVETAQGILDMGSTVLKLSMSARYCTIEYGLPRNPRVVSLRTLAEFEPSFRRVFAMGFCHYLIWAYSFSQYDGHGGQSGLVSFGDGLSRKEADQVYTEFHDLASYLLTAYSGTGKVFYIGHWEGDWHLRPDFDRERPLDETTVQGMIDWLTVRQRAIDDARRETPHHGVEVYHYTEVNLVRRGMHGQDCLTTRVLPHVPVDYVSYSSWDSSNDPGSAEAMREALFAALDFIESHLPPRPGLPPGKRVWIGEYGYPAFRFTEQETDRRSRWVIRAGLEWGCPFVLYWEFYNNEIEPDGSQRGYWMIDDRGNRTAVYETHAAYYREARAFVARFLEAEGRLPSQQELAHAALDFASLNP